MMVVFVVFLPLAPSSQPVQGLLFLPVLQLCHTSGNRVTITTASQSFWCILGIHCQHCNFGCQ